MFKEMASWAICHIHTFGLFSKKPKSVQFESNLHSWAYRISPPCLAGTGKDSLRIIVWKRRQLVEKDNRDHSRVF